MEKSSVIKSSAFIALASVINVVFGFVRTKAVAYMLGPSGLGTIALIQSFIALVSTVASCGIANAGTKAVAQVVGDKNSLANVRKSLFLGALLLSLVGGSGVVLARFFFPSILPDAADHWSTYIAALAVLLTVAGTSQTAFIRGAQYAKYTAAVLIFGGALSACLGVLSLFFLGQKAVYFFVLTAPIAAFFAGLFFVKKIKSVQTTILLSDAFVLCLSIVRNGFPLMLASVSVVTGQYLLRVILERNVGAHGLGLFQSVWMVSTAYIGFVLTTMGNEYFPRLASISHIRTESVLAINRQAEFILTVSSPILLVTSLYADIIIRTLFSDEFGDAAYLLTIFIVGDFIKVVGFPLRYLLMVGGEGGAFLISELIATLSMIFFVWLAIPKMGVEASAWGYVLMQAFSFFAYYVYARKEYKFKWSLRAKRAIMVPIVLAVCYLYFAAFFESSFKSIERSVFAASVFLIYFIFLYPILKNRK